MTRLAMKTPLGSGTLVEATSGPILQRKCACGAKNKVSGACTACDEKEKKGMLQRKATSDQDLDEVPPIVYEVLRTSGQPLDAATRAFMEPRFGHDFSHVRVHTGSEAAFSAEVINARAYTVGTDISFGKGQYNPGTREGERLLAHELTHVVQQGSKRAGNGTLKVGQATSSAETEADQTANRIHETEHFISASHSSPLSIQRAAPAAAVGISALAGKCIIGAVIGTLFDLAIQSGMHMWRRGEISLEGMTVDLCSVILSAILGCLGGLVAARWLEPWLNSELGGLAGTLIGKVLVFIASKLGIGIPRAVVKKLLHMGCVTNEQAEALAAGVSRELQAESGETTAGRSPQVGARDTTSNFEGTQA